MLFVIRKQVLRFIQNRTKYTFKGSIYNAKK